MKELRFNMLTAPASDFGYEPTADNPWVCGVAMDWPIGSGHVATIISFCDGSASLYTTGSFGAMGGLYHERVKAAAIKFSRLAGQMYVYSEPAKDCNYPSPDRVYFYLKCFEGLRLINRDGELIKMEKDPLHTLFVQGQTVLAELRRMMDEQKGK